jgi:hypothetical protein
MLLHSKSSFCEGDDGVEVRWEYSEDTWIVFDKLWTLLVLGENQLRWSTYRDAVGYKCLHDVGVLVHSYSQFDRYQIMRKIGCTHRRVMRTD